MTSATDRPAVWCPGEEWWAVAATATMIGKK